jgi:putative acetyltransferase
VILAVVRDAFATGGHDSQEEVDIVDTTWSLGAGWLELVAVDGGDVVGQVLAAYGDLEGRAVVGVAPLCVVTSRQGEGIGTALMTELLRRAEQGQLPLLVVLGEPAYYSRFGFEPAGPLDISYPPVGQNSPYFQVCRLATYEPGYRGAFAYCWERSRS